MFSKCQRNFVEFIKITMNIYDIQKKSEICARAPKNRIE